MQLPANERLGPRGELSSHDGVVPFAAIPV